MIVYTSLDVDLKPVRMNSPSTTHADPVSAGYSIFEHNEQCDYSVHLNRAPTQLCI